MQFFPHQKKKYIYGIELAIIFFFLPTGFVSAIFTHPFFNPALLIIASAHCKKNYADVAHRAGVTRYVRLTLCN